MSQLLEYFEKNEGRVIHKWMHYFDIYERHFSRFKNSEVYVLEIGVGKGGSLQMWKDYFGPKSQIVGIDIREAVKQYAEDQIDIHIGSQCNVEFLNSICAQYPRFDIIIDDGSHLMSDITTSFITLYSHVSEHGLYLVEDLHTSYWAEYEGGYRRRSSFIEYAKDLIDELNAFHSKDSTSFQITKMTTSLNAIHFYDSIVVFEKTPRLQKSKALKTGCPES